MIDENKARLEVTCPSNDEEVKTSKVKVVAAIEELLEVGVQTNKRLFVISVKKWDTRNMSDNKICIPQDGRNIGVDVMMKLV